MVWLAPPPILPPFSAFGNKSNCQLFNIQEVGNTTWLGEEGQSTNAAVTVCVEGKEQGAEWEWRREGKRKRCNITRIVGAGVILNLALPRPSSGLSTLSVSRCCVLSSPSFFYVSP